MSELIERQATIVLIENTPYNWNNLTERRIMINAIKSLPSAQQWIPCSERLPERLGEYLITALSNPSKNPISSVGYYHERIKEFGTFDRGGNWEKWDVIAWMPLPEPYTEEQHE